MPLEILYGALVLFSGRARLEGAEISAPAGLRVHFSGIETVFTRLQLSDHGTGLFDTPVFLQPWERSIVPAQERAPRAPRRADQPRMRVEDTTAEIAAIIAEAAPLPLQDAAYAIWRRRYRFAGGATDG
jgi:hypothetical protein